MSMHMGAYEYEIVSYNSSYTVLNFTFRESVNEDWSFNDSVNAFV